MQYLAPSAGYGDKKFHHSAPNAKQVECVKDIKGNRNQQEKPDKTDKEIWIETSLKMIFLLIAVLACPLIGQVPVFGEKDTIVLKWMQEPTDDLAGFRAYFLPDSAGDAVELNITAWDDVSDTLSTNYALYLHPGLWKVYMTAYDKALNESEPSDPVGFAIKNAAPGKPYQVQIMLKKKVN